jgi:ectoine hydroxylase-related dioxygenase (phytanoyl-CoA dioxygenase family)
MGMSMIAEHSSTLKRRPNRDEKQFFQDYGYLILEGFFEPSRIGKLKLHIDELWETRHKNSPLVIDGFDNDIGKYVRTYFREVDVSYRRRPYKLNDTHLIYPIIQDIAADARLVAVLKDLLLSDPVVCNTLLFERGSQQPLHFDTFYMPSKTRNMMAASWIAIDPVTTTNGPLVYYPKSRLIEPYRFSNGGIRAVAGEYVEAEAHIKKIIAEFKLEDVKFYPNPGDVLIWHAQLLHGGSPIKNPDETRASLVTHY